jgi:hypothetical protein
LARQRVSRFFAHYAGGDGELNRDDAALVVV